MKDSNRVWTLQGQNTIESDEWVSILNQLMSSLDALSTVSNNNLIVTMSSELDSNLSSDDEVNAQDRKESEND
jgi:hypothetical protein